VNGKDYYYITHQEFDRLVSEGEMVEYVTYLGDQYGTSRAQICEVFSREKDVILNIDVEGAKALKGSGLLDFSVVYVFLTPSSLAILGERLRIRGTEDDKEIRARLTVAAQEVETLPLFDYLVVNDELDIAVDELRSIIIAERSRILHG
jgi:guanylate kinase